MQLAAFELRQLGGWRREPYEDLGQQWSTEEIVGVVLHENVLVGNVLHEGERPGANVVRLRKRVLIDPRRIHIRQDMFGNNPDQRVGVRGANQEGDVRLLQGDAKRVFVWHFQTGDLVGFAGVESGGAGDLRELVELGGGRFASHRQPVSEHHIAGSEGLPVAPGHVLTQVEGKLSRIVGNLERLRQVRDEVCLLYTSDAA